MTEPATFRPPLRGLGAPLALGGGAGVLVGMVTGVPPVLAALFGAVAAAIALTARHAGSVRVVAGEDGLAMRGDPALPPSAKVGSGDEPPPATCVLKAGWGELRLGFGIAQRGSGALQRY